MTALESGTYSSPSTLGRPSKVSKGPMKTYLNSQYHMDPPGLGRTGRCFGTTLPSVLDGHRDVLIPPRTRRRRSVGRRIVARGRLPACCRLDVADHRAPDRPQLDPVFGD